MNKITEKDLEGLPAKLINQLSAQQRSKYQIEDAIISILESADKISLDHLLIELYRNTGKIHLRQTMSMRMTRMANKGLIEKCGKSLYRMPQPSNNQTGN